MRSPTTAPRLPRLILVQVAGAALTGVILFATAGCGIKNGIDEYVVHFAPGTADATARAVGNACPQFGKAKLEPPAKGDLATNRAYPVRYDVTSASSADKASLTDCLKKYKVVRGVSDTNDEDT